VIGRDPLDPGATEALRALEMQLEAGVDLPRALRSAGRIGDARVAWAFGEAVKRAASGADAMEVLEALRPVLPRVDRAVLRAGWVSGTPERATERVLNRRQTLHSSRRVMRAQLVLPAIVFLLACLIAPLPDLLLGGSVLAYLVTALAPLLVVGALGLGFIAGARACAWAEHDTATGPGWLERGTRALPLIGGAERWHGVGVSMAVLADLLEAGFRVDRALAETARAVPRGFERGALAQGAERVGRGEALGAGMAGLPLPSDWRQALEVGEVSGEEEKVLRRLASEALTRYEDRMRAIGRWLPRILYALIALYVIHRIFSMVLGLSGAYPV
jgi:type II secretory pathway component PulF